MDYGRAIRIVRAFRGISQADLSKKADVSQSNLSIFESGAQQPNAKSVEKLAEGLDFPAYLLTFLASEVDFKQMPSDQQRDIAVQILGRLLQGKDDD